MKDKIIMIDSSEAAQPYTMQGWKSRNGYFYADEAAARYAGCTHRPCQKCEAPAEKLYTLCTDCRILADKDRYEAKTAVEWDGESMIYSQELNRFYSDPFDAIDDLEDDQTIADLKLFICEPNYVRQLDSDYYCDELHEDGELPSEVVEAMGAFNKAVEGIVLSWSPGNKRLSLVSYQNTGLARKK